MSYHGNTKPPTRPRVEESARIAADLAAFLKRGGRIEHVPRGTSALDLSKRERRGVALQKSRAYQRRKVLFE